MPELAVPGVTPLSLVCGARLGVTAPVRRATHSTLWNHTLHDAVTETCRYLPLLGMGSPSPRYTQEPMQIVENTASHGFRGGNAPTI